MRKRPRMRTDMVFCRGRLVASGSLERRPSLSKSGVAAEIPSPPLGKSPRRACLLAGTILSPGGVEKASTLEPRGGVRRNPSQAEASRRVSTDCDGMDRAGGCRGDGRSIYDQIWDAILSQDSNHHHHSREAKVRGLGVLTGGVVTGVKLVFSVQKPGI